MPPPIVLRRKFLIPRRGPDRRPRPQLLAWLKHNLDKRLLLVSAPPGYGKTTLLAEFAAEQPAAAWYQLDTADGDPAVFLAYLIECLAEAPQVSGRTFGSAARGLLQNAEAVDPVAPERILIVLINELAEVLERDWVLILEDYHLITNPAVHALLDYLIENAPPLLHLVISTRSDPPLALPRLRARGWLAELRANDLRFSLQEISQWLAGSPLDLSEKSLRTLSEKTEGWAAGLQLVLSSLNGRDPGSAERFIAELSGVQRFIFEYLADEVFHGQPPARQRFLMSTAVLTQMSAAVCNALPDISDSQTTLEKLEQDNLFVASLDENREWYRYHPLFREFLLGKLQHEQAERVLILERAAGEYYETHHEPEMALTHYLPGNDPESAARVIAAFATDYVERGRVEVLQRYLGALPEPILRARPELLLNQGDALRRLGRAAAAVARYEDAQAAFEARSDHAGVCRALTELAEIARSRGDYRHAQSLATEALAHAPADDYAGRARALMAQAKVEGFLTGMDRGRDLAEAAVEAARQAGDALTQRARAALLRSMGQICWWQGDPYATVRYCQEALQFVPDELSPIAAEVLMTMATPHLYWRDLDTALRCAERGLEIAQRLQLNELLPMAYATLGNVLTRCGESARAENCLRQAMDLSRGLGLETYAQVMAAGFLAYNLCRQGRLDETRQLAEAALWPYAGGPDTYEVCVCRSVLADVALESDQFDQAEALFANLLEVEQRRQFRIPLAMVYFGFAYIDLKTGRSRQGLEMAGESLKLIEPTGAVQLYLDQGERARVVAQALAASGVRSAFMTRVLDSLADDPARSLIAVKDHAVVRIKSLGQFRVTLGEIEVDQERWVSAKARDLLAYFITHHHDRLPLDRALEALWPDAAGRGKTAFHTALYRLRQALRTPEQSTKFVLVEAGEYWLDTAWFQVDVDDFDAALAKARVARNEEAARWYEQALSFYNGEYLDNLYYDWVMPERLRLREAYLSALRGLAAHRAAAGNYREALLLAQRALQIDPLLEDVYCEAMRYCAGLKDRGSLLRHYQSLQQVLDEELGDQPLPATQQLYTALLERMTSQVYL